MPYTNVAKPTDSTYTNVNASGGKEGFDDASATFDQATTFFDGINNAAYTDIALPTGTPYTNIAKPT